MIFSDWLRWTLVSIDLQFIMLFKPIIFIILSCLLNLVESQGQFPSTIQSDGNGNTQANTIDHRSYSSHIKSEHTDPTDVSPNDNTDQAAHSSMTQWLKIESTTIEPAEVSMRTTEADAEAGVSTITTTITKTTITKTTTTTTTTTESEGLTTAPGDERTPSSSTIPSKGATITAFYRRSLFYWLFTFFIALCLIV